MKQVRKIRGFETFQEKSLEFVILKNKVFYNKDRIFKFKDKINVPKYKMNLEKFSKKFERFSEKYFCQRRLDLHITRFEWLKKIVCQTE